MRTSALGSGVFRAPGGVVGGAGDRSTPPTPMAAASFTCSSLCVRGAGFKPCCRCCSQE